MRAPWAESQGRPRADDLCIDFVLGVTRKNQRHPQWLECARIAYASEVAAVDDAIAALFEGLPVSRDDFVILTSDHGEEFSEHGLSEHGKTLYEEVSRIPLLLRLPDFVSAGDVISAPVSLVDIMPSILDFVGLEIPEEVQGASFLAAMAGEDSQRPIFLSLERQPGRTLDAIVDGRWKFILQRENATRELYDLERDPGEMVNLYRNEKHRDVREDLTQKLLNHIIQTQEEPTSIEVREFHEKLRKLPPEERDKALRAYHGLPEKG